MCRSNPRLSKRAFPMFTPSATAPNKAHRKPVFSPKAPRARRRRTDLTPAQPAGPGDAQRDRLVLHRVRRRADWPSGRRLLFQSRWPDGHVLRAVSRSASRQGAFRFKPSRALVWNVARKAANQACRRSAVLWRRKIGVNPLPVRQRGARKCQIEGSPSRAARLSIAYGKP